MPCVYEDDGRSIDAEIARKRAEELDKVTRLLCQLCARIVHLDGYNSKFHHLLDPETYTWYQEHVKADRLREERERKAKEEEILRKKKRALAKLSAEEKEILGLE